MKPKKRSIIAGILAAIIAALMVLTACGVNGARDGKTAEPEKTAGPGKTTEPEKNLWEQLEAGEYIDRDTLEGLLEETMQEIEQQHQRNLECIENGFKELREVRPGVPDENYETYFLDPYLEFYEEVKDSIDGYSSAASGAANLVFMGGTGATDVTLRETVLYARSVLEQLKRIEIITNK
ncbi:MAG: hypothetical protein J5950_10515 [Clostridia bacterium]|nr:hypothetical protein [Clostridia bacterium]